MKESRNFDWLTLARVSETWSMHATVHTEYGMYRCMLASHRWVAGSDRIMMMAIGKRNNRCCTIQICLCFCLTGLSGLVFLHSFAWLCPVRIVVSCLSQSGPVLSYSVL